MGDVIEVFTDGGSRANGTVDNLGAWAYTAEYQGAKREDSKAVYDTTNNKMELQACIEALKSMKRKDIPIIIYSDSAYTINGIGKEAGLGWVVAWKANGWTRGKKNEKILNLELWQELDELRNSFDSVEFIKVRGHSDSVGNNRADELVNKIMDEEVLIAKDNEIT